MYPASFEYFRAASVEEAIALLHRHKDAKVLAGGHSLLPIMKLRLAEPQAVVDIGHVHILRGISSSEGSVRVGALTTHAEIAASDTLRQHCPLLADAAAHIGDIQVRNKGTIGGNIAHADPASDLPAVLVVLGATVHMSGPAGDRRVAAADFFTGLLETALAEDEIITAIDLPAAGEDSGSAYLKFEHPASGYAICGAAAVVTGSTVGLAFNGVTEIPHHATAVGAALAGTEMTDADIDRTVNEHLSIADPLGDIQASGEYRVELAKVYGQRALQQARNCREVVC